MKKITLCWMLLNIGALIFFCVQLYRIEQKSSVVTPASERILETNKTLFTHLNDGMPKLNHLIELMAQAQSNGIRVIFDSIETIQTLVWVGIALSGTNIFGISCLHCRKRGCPVIPDGRCDEAAG
jgi:hypothetical protein